MKMHCPNCHSKLSEEAKFCHKCGFNLKEIAKNPEKIVVSPNINVSPTISASGNEKVEFSTAINVSPVITIEEKQVTHIVGSVAGDYVTGEKQVVGGDIVTGAKITGDVVATRSTIGGEENGIPDGSGGRRSQIGSTRRCPNCGKEVQADEKFCTNCGAGIGRGGA